MQTRRDFIKAGGFVAGGVALGLSPRSYARVIGANDRIRVGVVGFSDRGRQSLFPAFMAQAKDLNMEIVAVSDIWNRRRDEGLAYFKERNSPVTAYRNNEELYQKGKVDAVIISTADFQHALHGVEAVQAGCDAYIEKPLANTLDDAKAIKKAVEKSGKIVQIGTQRRSGANYQQAAEYIQSGKFGKVVMVELVWNVNQPGRWRRPELVAAIKETDTDWKRFLMNRPFEPWDARKYLEYRTFWPYSSGIPDQWMVHQIDTVHWFSGLPRPRSVVVNSNIYQWDDGRRNADTLTAVFDYGPLDSEKGGFQVLFTSRMSNAEGGIKEIYLSNGGTMNLDTNTISPSGGLTADHAKAMGMQPNLLQDMKLEQNKVAAGANTGTDAITSAHVRNWMECLRSRKQPNASVEAGYNHSVALCMTIAAMQTGRKCYFDDVKQDVRLG